MIEASEKRALAAVHSPYAPVDQRVAEILAGVRRDCAALSTTERNRDNERQVEEFIALVRSRFGERVFEVARGPKDSPAEPNAALAWETARRRTDASCVVIERQRLGTWAVRTTRWNYLFTVPGESTERIFLVAHYDTWRGPGADDNTTGEEIVKQYLLADLRSSRRPALTRTYFLAGSEECGLVGLLSQILVALGLQAANLALTQKEWLYGALAVALAPLLTYRFGVSGSREYVKTLKPEELSRIRGVVSVDSVGEGRLYIPRGTLGADILHVLIPFGDYDSINSLLEEGAHLHGIKYNNYLAGGTTDHVSFLEVNNGLWSRMREGVRRVAARLERRPYTPPLRIPATALVAMTPGKASPIVFGGKIHTPNDTPDRVFPTPLRETLLILDYFFHRLEGHGRIGEPRYLDEFHYARLYRTSDGFLLALKDALAHNRRNVNGVYRVAAQVNGRRATARVERLVQWGVKTRLRDQVADACAELGVTWERERIDELSVIGDGVRLHFVRRMTWKERMAKLYHRALAAAQGVIRRLFFATFFVMAYALARLFGWAFETAFDLWPRFANWVADHVVLTLAGLVALELAILLYMMARRIPTWIDNGYRHENRADNLGSLRRVRLEAVEQPAEKRVAAGS